MMFLTNPMQNMQTRACILYYFVEEFTLWIFQEKLQIFVKIFALIGKFSQPKLIKDICTKLYCKNLKKKILNKRHGFLKTSICSSERTTIVVFSLKSQMRVPLLFTIFSCFGIRFNYHTLSTITKVILISFLDKVL